MYPRIVCAFAIMLAVAFAWPSGVWAQAKTAAQAQAEAERLGTGVVQREDEDSRPGFLTRILRGAVNAYREADRALADVEMEYDRTIRQQEHRSACMDRAQTAAAMRHCAAMPPH